MENDDVKLDDSLLGFAALNQDIALFKFGNIVVRKNYKECPNVRLISGGSVFFEKFVGKGMLTASVQGEENEGPTSKLILRVIRELCVNHHKGILVIVQGDSSEILNFGLAVERAVNDDLHAMILGVADDALNREFSKTNKRGLSGIIFLIKIAGTMAENGASLSEIHDFCSKVLDNISSSATYIGRRMVENECVFCKRCKLPESELDSNLRRSKSALLDRKSKSRVDTQTINFMEVIKEMYTDILVEGKLNLDPESNNMVVILINNQKALDKHEEYLFVKEVIAMVQSSGMFIVRLYIGNYLNLNYNLDLTFSILKVFHRDVLEYLDQECNVPGWKAANQHMPHLTLENNTISGCLKRKCRLSPPIKGPKLKDRPTNVLQLCLQFACDAVISCAKILNKIDAERGDGDTGTRLKNVAEVLHKRIKEKKLVLNYPFTFFLSLSKILENTVSGTSGCIYSILFEAAANKFGQYGEEDEVTPLMWLEALENGCKSVKKFGNVELGDHTMYDSLHMCAITVRENLTETGENYMSAYEMGVAEAEKAAESSKGEGCRFPDPGAHAVGIWMRAVFEGVRLRCD